MVMLLSLLLLDIYVDQPLLGDQPKSLPPFPGPTADEVTNAGTSRSAMESADFQQLGRPLRYLNGK